MIGREPPCLDCKLFRGGPKHPGDSGHCSVVGTIPERIYWCGGDCDNYDPKYTKEEKMEYFLKNGKLPR